MLFAVVVDFANDFAGIGIAGHCAEGHLKDNVLATGSGAILLLARCAGFGNHVFPILQVQQRPELCISTKPDISSFSAITAIGTAKRYVFFPPEMPEAGSPRT